MLFKYTRVKTIKIIDCFKNIKDSNYNFQLYHLADTKQPFRTCRAYYHLLSAGYRCCRCEFSVITVGVPTYTALHRGAHVRWKIFKIWRCARSLTLPQTKKKIKLRGGTLHDAAIRPFCKIITKK